MFPRSPDNAWWQTVEKSSAGRITAEIPAAQTKDRLNTSWKLEKPRCETGYVRIWNARAVALHDTSSTALGLRGGFADYNPQKKDAEEYAESSANESSGQLDAFALRLKLILQPPLEIMLRPNGTLAWPAPLFSFQKEGVLTLLRSRHLLLGDEMGLGKTVQVIAALRVLMHRREAERALIVAPASLLQQWSSEVRKWAPELRIISISGSPQERRWQWHYRVHIALVSYETLRADSSSGASGGPSRVPWDIVVLDEAQRIKNRETDIARACKKLARRRAWALSGTPLENSADDVVSILEFVIGNWRPNMLLRPMLDRHQLRRRKADVLSELPPKINTTLRLPLSPSQQRAYDLAENEGILELRIGRSSAEVRIESVLALITRLKQICNFTPQGDSAKLEDMRSRLEEITAAGHKALIFTQYTDEIFGARRLSAQLSRFSPLLYTGDLDARQRNQAIEQFKSDPRRQILILSLRAGGQGLNLQNASYVFHYDQWWNPATAHQAEDRAHRLGQTHPVHIYRYLMRNTIEERIERVLAGKLHLFDQLIEGAGPSKRSFSQKELLGLLGL